MKNSNTPEFIQKIDWNKLKEQKAALLTSITYFETHYLKSIADNLEGILSLIDAIQDYAVDEMGLPETVVFDFDDENVQK